MNRNFPGFIRKAVFWALIQGLLSVGVFPSTAASYPRLDMEGEKLLKRICTAVTWEEVSKFLENRSLSPVTFAPWAFEEVTPEGRSRFTIRSLPETIRFLEEQTRNSSGTADQLWRLGEICIRGMGVPQDPSRSRGYFERAARMNSAEAIISFFKWERGGRIQDSYYSPERFKYPLQRAREILYAKGTAGDPEAFIKLALTESLTSGYWNGRFPYSTDQTREFLSKAEADLRERAERGSTRARFLLAQLWSSSLSPNLPGGSWDSKDWINIESMLRSAAEEGHLEASLVLGWRKLLGKGLQQNVREGMEFVRRAAEAGDPRGQVLLGRVFLYGQGVSPDDGEARNWIERAAQQGYGPGFFHQALLHLEGRGYPKDREKALEFMKQAVDAGDNDAALFLALTRGREVSRSDELQKVFETLLNLTEAENPVAQFICALILIQMENESERKGSRYHGVWREYGDGMLLKSARNGFAPARIMAGMRVLNGTARGWSHNKDEAVAWIREGSRAGNWNAQLFLGQLLVSQGDTGKDADEAFFLFTRVSKFSPQEDLRKTAEEELEKLRPKLAPDRIKEAEDRAFQGQAEDFIPAEIPEPDDSEWFL